MAQDSPNSSLPSQDREAVMAYLERLYAGVFDPADIIRHIEDYVGFNFVDQIVPLVCAQCEPGAKVLDVGSGFGSFVLRARERGLDAIGIEIAEFEVNFARQRLARMRPQDDPSHVYQMGDALQLDLPSESIDAVTLWNVLEHIDNYSALLAFIKRVLRPGGSVYIICPNYAAFRKEAHYQVPWYPFFPRPLAGKYLSRHGKDPGYFETAIFYRTNWGVLWLLKRLGFEVYEISNTMSMDIKLGNLSSIVRNAGDFLRFYNPLKESILLAARTS
jgi:ubiquinone/menaquinone biosynthesis C-methylase UbiE